METKTVIQSVDIFLVRFGERSGSPGTGHFSQVVWAASRRLGVGLASGGGKVIILSYQDLIMR